MIVSVTKTHSMAVRALRLKHTWLLFVYPQIVSTPFVMTNEHVQPILETAVNMTVNGTVVTGWLGKLEFGPGIGSYIDSALMLTFGGIPWQVIRYHIYLR